MVKNIKLVLHGLKHTCCLSDAVEFAEEAYELGLEQVLVVETVFDYEREDLVKLFEGSAEFQEYG